MSVAKDKIAEAIAVAEAEVHGKAATLPPHLVKRANEARQANEALAVLRKRVEADKRFFDDLLKQEGVTEFRNAEDRTIVILNSAAPVRLDQKELRERFPKQAEECTHPSPYTFVTFP